MTEASDSDLVDACLRGQSAAWETLIGRYRRLIYSVPVKLGLDPSDCDEVFQQTALTLLDKLGTLRDRARIGLWLAVTARRKAIDLVSRGAAKREVELSPTLELESLGPLPLDRLVELEQAAGVREAIERLSDRCRQLLAALYYEDPTPSYKEIARRLGVAIGSLGPTRARCFGHLKSSLAADGRITVGSAGVSSVKGGGEDGR